MVGMRIADVQKTLITTDQQSKEISDIINRAAAQASEDHYRGKNPLLVCVLREP